jgi:hypothetical protein
LISVPHKQSETMWQAAESSLMFKAGFASSAARLEPGLSGAVLREETRAFVRLIF